MAEDFAQKVMVLQAYSPLGCLYWQSDSRSRWRYLGVLSQASQHRPGGLPPRPQGSPVCSPTPSCRPLEVLFFTLPHETGSATGSRQPAGMHGHPPHVFCCSSCCHLNHNLLTTTIRHSPSVIYHLLRSSASIVGTPAS
ncbi:unnamed protein product [Cercospora beticola]|nr:unnamed protein product [Cercospora beticola]